MPSIDTNFDNQIANDMESAAKQLLQGTEFSAGFLPNQGKNLSDYVTKCIMDDNITECKGIILKLAHWLADFAQKTQTKFGKSMVFSTCRFDQFYITQYGAFCRTDWTRWKFGEQEEQFAALILQIRILEIERKKKQSIEHALWVYFHTLSRINVAKISQVCAQKEQSEEKILKSTAVILAGGHASRMNYYPKFKVKMGNYTFLQYIQYTLDGLPFAKKALSVFPGQRVENCDLPKWKDEIAEIGPISGLQTALSKSETEFVFVVPCDMPTISEEIITFLFAQMGSGDASVLPSVNGKINPLTGIYRTNQSTVLRQMIQNGCRRPWQFAQRISAKIVELPANLQNAILSFNSMEELHQKQNMLKNQQILPPTAFFDFTKR